MESVSGYQERKWMVELQSWVVECSTKNIVDWKVDENSLNILDEIEEWFGKKGGARESEKEEMYVKLVNEIYSTEKNVMCKKMTVILKLFLKWRRK